MGPVAPFLVPVVGGIAGGVTIGATAATTTAASVVGGVLLTGTIAGVGIAASEGFHSRAE